MEQLEKDQNAFEVNQLTVNYENTPALWDFSLAVPKGNLVGIIGPNGAGKTTFLKTAMGLIRPLSGKISFFGKPLKKVRRRVAYVPQKESVDWDFPITVIDLVLMGAYGRLGLFRWATKKDREQAYHYLEKVGMECYADRQISQLSGGQQQRVFIARALMQHAEIYFLDEPFSGIDIATEQVIVDLLGELRDQGKTLFVVHHDLSTVHSYFDWVIMLNIRLVASGPVDQVFNSEMLTATYGKSYSVLDEALKLSQSKTTGML